MRNRAFRRHQAERHMRRRLKEDRNQHYDDLTCPCWHDPRAMARFKEQPQRCSCWGCGNQRRYEGKTI
jgi:phage terminase small subunit